MNTIEVAVFICKGINGAPTDVYGMHVNPSGNTNDYPKPEAEWSAKSYWALSADGYGKYPPVLMHIYYEGDLPPDRTRDGINVQVKKGVAHALFGEPLT